jgi:hypothetical protein
LLRIRLSVSRSPRTEIDIPLRAIWLLLVEAAIPNGPLS